MKHLAKVSPRDCEVEGCLRTAMVAYCAACCVKLCDTHMENHPCAEWCREAFCPHPREPLSLAADAKLRVQESPSRFIADPPTTRGRS